MIIARGHNNDGPGEFLLLGLSRENINRLLAGQPIVMSQQTHGEGVPAGWTIAIIAGETEDEIVKALEDAGIMTPHTQKHVMPGIPHDER